MASRKALVGEVMSYYLGQMTPANFKVRVEGIPAPGTEGADLHGRELAVVEQGDDYWVTDDGSVWTSPRHGGYNMAVRGPVTREGVYQELLRLVRV